jgi:hypothetical protein
MDRLAAPAELSGTLIAVLLPLRTSSVPALSTDRVRGTLGGGDVFLASRAELVAPPKRSWRQEADRPRYDEWGRPVLLARAEWSTSELSVVFGRSASTVAEYQSTDQPVVLPESAAASLWLVRGIGLVLGLERLRATHDVAGVTDHVGRLLRFPVQGVERHENAYAVPDAARGIEEALEELAVPREASLVDLFGEQVDDLGAVLTVGDPIVGQLVPSRTARAGHRLVEGFAVGLGAAERSSELRVDSLLFRAIEGDEVDFDESDRWQTEGYRWDFEPFDLTTEPARADALCAMRSDGRVAVVDLDALSIYHDYLGVGGDGIVRELIPLAAMAGQLAHDQLNVVEQLEHMAADGDLPDSALSEGLGLARRVRARLELRTLQQAQLLDGKNFRAWTTDESLRREMAPRAMRDQFSADGSFVSEQLQALGRSVGSLEDALQRREAEVAVITERKREERQQRLRSTISLLSGVVTAAGLVAVFTSLASVPGPTERAVPSLATAGLWTLFSLALLALLGGVGFLLVEGTRVFPGQRTRAAVVLLGLAGATSGVGLLASPGTQGIVLAVACVAVFAASLMVVLDLRRHRLAERQPA